MSDAWTPQEYAYQSESRAKDAEIQRLRSALASAEAQLSTVREKALEGDAGLRAAIRAAELALFVIRKQGVMPNTSWETGFNSDLATAKNALAALSSLPPAAGRGENCVGLPVANEPPRSSTEGA